MKKAIKYLRYSSDGQSQHSIERQEMITSYWTTHHNIAVTDTFIDEGHTARTFDRPDMNALMAFVKKNYRDIDYLVVSELSRFSRQAGDAINLVTKIQRNYNIRIVSASSSNIFDVHDSNSFLLMGLEFLISNSENIKRTNDINGGIYTAKAEGRWIQGGPAPFGFTKEGLGKERKLVVREDQSAIVRFIYEAFLKNTPAYIIANDAKKMGLKRTSNSAIQEMLSNPLYMGYQQVQPWKNHPGGLFPLKNHSSIIDEATWYRVQNKLKDKNRPRVSIADNFPLRQVVRCHCGLPLTGAPSRNGAGKYFDYYKCKVSGHNTINAGKAHGQLQEILSLLSLPIHLITAIENKSDTLLKERMKTSVATLAVKRKELEAVEVKMKSVEEKFILNQLNFESYNDWHRRLQHQRIDLYSSIEQLDKNENRLYFLLQKNLSRLSDLQHIYNSGSTVQKQELIRQVFDSGLYYKNKSYRTPSMMRIFSHNLLTLSQQSLLFIDEPERKSGEVEATGVEPVSKHIRRKLSTCLFHYYLSAMNRK